MAAVFTKDDTCVNYAKTNGVMTEKLPYLKPWAVPPNSIAKVAMNLNRSPSQSSVKQQEAGL